MMTMSLLRLDPDMSDVLITQPLTGIKVVEFSTMITASLATMMFAQQGADVIKVEPPGIGDPMRWLGSQKAGISGLFNNCNRSKRSIALDLKSAADVSVAKQLCADADIVIHNYRAGVMDRLGLGSETLRRANPRLIYCAITGFGLEGPMAQNPAYDHVMQAMSGLMALQGSGTKTNPEKDDGDASDTAAAPQNFAYMKTLLCDKITAYTAAQGITAALYAREKRGEGQHIDLSMLHSCLAFLWPDGMMHLTLLDDDVVQGVPFSDYYQMPLRTADGAVAFAAMSDENWAHIFDIIGKPELKKVERYQGIGNRSIHIAELSQRVTADPLPMTNAQLCDAMTAKDIPNAPCIPLNKLKNNEQVVAIEAVEVQQHPILGEVHNAAAPIKFGGQPLPASQPSAGRT